MSLPVVTTANRIKEQLDKVTALLAVEKPGVEERKAMTNIFTLFDQNASQQGQAATSWGKEFDTLKYRVRVKGNYADVVRDFSREASSSDHRKRTKPDEGDDQSSQGPRGFFPSVFALQAASGRPAAGPPPVADRSSAALLTLLKSIFTPAKLFEQADDIAVACYELIWKLSAADRDTFLTFYNKGLFGDDAQLQPNDLSVLRKWVMELFLRTNGMSDALPSVSLEIRYLNPSILSPYGQRWMMLFISQMFHSQAEHSGGVSSKMVLQRPNVDAIVKMNELIKAEYKKTPAAVPAARPSRSKAPARAPAEDPFAPGAPPPPVAEKAVDEEAKRTIPLDGVALGLIPANYTDVRFDVLRDTVTIALYQTRLRSHFDEWFNGAKTVPSTVQNYKDDEQLLITAVHQAKTNFEQKLKDFSDEVDKQREKKRLLITDAARTRLKTLLASIDSEFVGMYKGRADLITYLLAQLTGPRPRGETSNHMIVRGEPGTGKTSLAKRLRALMVTVGLIEPASIAAFKAVGNAYMGSLSESEDKIVSERTVFPPPTKNAVLEANVGHDAYVAMVSARQLRSGDNRDMVYRPADFDSTYQGGPTRQFALGVMRTMGAVMVIDEAYSLVGATYVPVVDLLTEMVTSLKLQWGSMLMGYPERMDELLNTVNEGLSRRYNARLTLEPYTSLEIAAIIIKNIISADTTVLSKSIADIRRIVEASEWEVPVKELFDGVWAAVAPYALRPKEGLHDPMNIFGVSNAGGAIEAFTAVAIANMQGESEGLIRFITAETITTVFDERKKSGRYFGEWSRVPVKKPEQD